jgi:hypothetical protein
MYPIKTYKGLIKVNEMLCYGIFGSENKLKLQTYLCISKKKLKKWKVSLNPVENKITKERPYIMFGTYKLNGNVNKDDYFKVSSFKYVAGSIDD